MSMADHACSSSAGLLSSEEAAVPTSQRRRPWGAWAAAGLATTALASLGAAATLRGRRGPSAALNIVTGRGAYDWSVYKYTIPVGNASAAPLEDLASKIFGPVTVSDLGCGGLKISAGTTASAGPRLHFVQSATLSNDPTPIDEWERYWVALHGDMTAWNGFMHSKATLFTTQFAKVLANLETKVPVMRRKSTGYTFDAAAHPDWTGDVAHALFPIRGRVYEVVGPATTAMEKAFKISDWETWGADECEAAHRLDDSLEDYASTFGAYSTGYDEDDSQYADWAASTGYWPPMLAAVSTAVPEHFTKGVADGTLKLADALADITSTALALETVEAGACVVAHAATVSTYTGFKLPLKYVYNAKAQVRGESSVDDFNRYVANAHENIAGAYPDWAGWDHWLDFHVGLKYGQEHNAAANATAQKANARLLGGDVPVGQRYETGGEIHWYAGFEGALTVELCVKPNTTDLAAASRNDLAEICTCRADNNLEQYVADTGTNCSMGAVSL